MSAGTVTIGRVVSTTLILKLAEPVLPWASVTEQVTVVSPMANIEPEIGLQVGTRLPSTMSVALALKVTIAPAAPVASTTMSAGTVTIGAVVSLTVIVKLAMRSLPWASMAVQVTVVTPSGKMAPEAVEQTTVGAGSALSVAVAAKVTTAPAALVASTVMSAGRLRTGGVVSFTVIVKVPVLWLPEASVAVQLTIVTPTAKAAPEAGAQTTDGAGSAMSVAVALKLTGVPAGLVASTVMLAGTVRVGGVVSTMVILRVLVVALPEASVPVQLTIVIPRGKVSPEVAEQTRTGAGSMLSTKVGWNVTTLPAGLVASKVLSSSAGGKVKVGGVVSIVNVLAVLIPMLPAASAWEA